MDELLATSDAAANELLTAARGWGLPPGAVAGASFFRAFIVLAGGPAHAASHPAVVGGDACASVLASAAAAGLRAVVVSGDGSGLGVEGSLRRVASALAVPRALASPRDALVGLALSAARDASLLRDGLVHALPRHGVAALRVDLGAPLAPQGPWHALLHKATDQVAHGSRPEAPRFAPEVAALEAYADAHPATALVEPLQALDVVFDRGCSAALLNTMPQQLRSGGGGAHAALAAPRTVAIDTWEPYDVVAALEGAGIRLPCLLKPRAACGVPGSHAMALLLRASAGAEARVALPALAQAFVPHRGAFHKCYAIGDAVFSSSRRSLPAPPAPPAAEEEDYDYDAPGALPFDSLAALPSRWGGAGDGGEEEGQKGDGARRASEPAVAPEPLDAAAVAACAAWLREATGLRLLGFDIVVDAETGAHTVVDVNYFPSCAQTPGAAEALAAMLRQAAGMPPVAPSPHHH